MMTRFDNHVESLRGSLISAVKQDQPLDFLTGPRLLVHPL